MSNYIKALDGQHADGTEQEIKEQNKITDTLKIVIFESSNEPGYIYDIYNSEDEEAESLDGGICTGSMKDALDMATDQTKDLINK